MLSPTMLLPQTTLLPQTMLSQSPAQPLPQTMLLPEAVLPAPQVTPGENAFDPGTTIPPLIMWLPQRMCLAHIGSVGTTAPGWAVAKKRASRTAPIEFKKPVP